MRQAAPTPAPRTTVHHHYGSSGPRYGGQAPGGGMGIGGGMGGGAMSGIGGMMAAGAAMGVGSAVAGHATRSLLGGNQNQG